MRWRDARQRARPPAPARPGRVHRQRGCRGGAEGLGAHLQHIGLGAALIGLRLLQLALRRLHIGDVQDIVDTCQHGVFIDDGAIVNGLAMDILAKGMNQPGDLRPDIDDFFGLNRTGRTDRGHQITTLDGQRPEYVWSVSLMAQRQGSLQ